MSERWEMHKNSKIRRISTKKNDRIISRNEYDEEMVDKLSLLLLVVVPSIIKGVV